VAGANLKLKLGWVIFSKVHNDNTQLQNNNNKLLIQIRTLLIYEIVNF
jgi:hypothetical protein